MAILPLRASFVKEPLSIEDGNNRIGPRKWGRRKVGLPNGNMSGLRAPDRSRVRRGRQRRRLSTPLGPPDPGGICHECGDMTIRARLISTSERLQGGERDVLNGIVGDQRKHLRTDRRHVRQPLTHGGLLQLVAQ